ncbi:hypothetical protein BDR07DRAFT_1380483 [Suillus spraguei]|nr:hypothetical protein BDR07DRAFT_1380483 [Suillus spraguei]
MTGDAAWLMQSVLKACSVHQCLDIILELLKQAACIGQMMSDPVGNLRHCFMPLASYIVDMPELASIQCDPKNVEAYFTACAPFCLSGFACPFWCDWPLTDPSCFLTPKTLHHWHCAFYDHDVQWCLKAVGAEKLDFCFSVLQPLTMFQHFKDGISNLKQVTGRAQRDLQHYIVALIADAAPPGIVMAVCALMDFRYLSQATVIDEEFHDHKQDIIACGACVGAKSKNNVLDNRHIPKLELMQSVVPRICQVRSLLQWSADTTKHAHITLIKDPTDSTNNNNSHAQAAGSPVMDNGLGSDDEGADVVEVDAQAAVNNHLWGLKHPVTNFFKKAEQVSSNIKATRPLWTFVVGSTAIHLNFDPFLWRIPDDVVAKNFPLPDSQGALVDYVQWEGHGHGTSQSFHKLEERCCAAPDASLPFRDLMVWFKVWVQQASYYNQSATPPALTINASPLSTTKKYGHYDAAIFAVNDTEGEQWPVTGLKGHAVVEVHLIMQQVPPRGKTVPWAGHFLTYVQCLDVVTQQRGSVLEYTMQMHVLKCECNQQGSLLVTSSYWINFILLPILSPGLVMLLMSI